MGARIGGCGRLGGRARGCEIGGQTEAHGRRRVDEGRGRGTSGAASAELADRLGTADARGVADQGWRCECRAGDVMLEGTRAVAVDDWCGGQSRGRWMRDQRTEADERGINCKAGDGSGLESSRFDG